MKENHLDAQTAKWFAIYTRFKSEKEVARRLAAKGIECYVPINKVVREYTRKRKTVELPLINCYAFVHITRSEYVPVLQTEHVSRFIQFSGNLISIPDAEINLLKRICQEISNIEVSELSFQRNQMVEIIGGNLTGVKGRLVEDRGHNFLVELDHVGIGLRMEIDPKLLKPLKGQFKSDNEELTQAMGKRYWD